VTPERLPTRIETERLLLRQWTEDDVGPLAEAVAASIDHLRPWMEWVAREPMSANDRRALIRSWREAWAAGGGIVLGMFVGKVIVGGTGFHRRVGEDDWLEIGYWVHVDHTRKGLATEAAAALTTAAFTLPKIERVEIRHDKANVASGEVPRRLGFTLVSEEPDEVRAPGDVGIECRWVMAREAWAQDMSG